MAEPSANTRFGDVRHFGTVASTNTVAAALAAEGARDCVVVVADHQTAGRGRRGRRWEAPPGSSLLLSVLLPQPAAGLATVAMAVAAADACEEVAGVRCGLKWPNDVVVGEGKVGGVLGEATAEAAVVGLGLNVNWGAVAPPAPGASLDALVGAPVDRGALLAAVLRHLDHRLAQAPAHLLEDYRARCTTLGRPVRVELPAGSIEGYAVDVTADGHLVVAMAAGGTRVVAAGDVVHLRAG